MQLEIPFLSQAAVLPQARSEKRHVERNFPLRDDIVSTVRSHSIIILPLCSTIVCVPSL